MTDETEAGLAPDDLDDANAPAGQDDTPDPGPSAEDRALTMGWTPKEQFKGDPARWVDAETFVKRGEEFLPFLKANNKRMEAALAKADEKIAKLNKTLEDFGEHHSKTAAREYQRALSDLEARQAAAVEANDVQAVGEITKEIIDLNKEAEGPKVEKTAPGKDLFEAWKTDNGWYDKDAAMRGAAIAFADELVAEGVTDPAKQLAEVTKRIKAEFPHKFENPRRREPGAVEAGGAPIKRGKSYSDLPPDAKKMCDEFVRDIKGFSKESYVRDYFGDSAR